VNTRFIAEMQKMLSQTGGRQTGTNVVSGIMRQSRRATFSPDAFRGCLAGLM
jgi:hypothetical protein